MSVSAPSSIDALVEAVARTSPAPLVVGGAGTKRPRPAEPARDGAHALDVRGLAGITAYDPAECVVTVLAGTPVRQVVDVLAAHGQYLPWDPPLVHEGATIGGMVASGLSGPGRYRYGGVRDFVIGARVVDGRGRLIASGGQVVKNAAGFLLHHALVGSAGRLGVIAEVSLKVFPRPEATCTIVAHADAPAAAVAAHERLRQARLDLDALDLDHTTGTVLVRIAGAADALAPRTARAVAALALPADVRHGDDESRVWHDAATRTWTGASVVKVPCAPSRLERVLTTLALLGTVRASVGGAVAYLSSERAPDDLDTAFSASALSGVVVRGGGHGRQLGAPHGAAFAHRVTATLDPDARFR